MVTSSIDPSYCSPPNAQHPLILHAENGNAVAAGFRKAIAGGDTRESAGGTGRDPILLQAAIHPFQVSQWKRQLLDGASEQLTRGRQTKDKEDGQAKEAELFQQIGRLQMELEWLKKSLSCSDARERRKLVDHDQPELSVSRQCLLLGLPRSTLYYRPTPVRESTLRIMARIDAFYLDDPCSGSRRMVE